MDKILIKKTTAVTAIIMLCLNIAFLSFRVYSGFVFWVVLGIIAVISLSIIKLIK